jgi:hypothetical protein
MRNVKRVAITPFVLLVALPSPALPSPMLYQLPPETAQLKPGPGVDTAIVCTACHSADYISTQPSRKGKAFWQAEVQKMIKVYKAPIGEADAAVIANYLAATY